MIALYYIKAQMLQLLTYRLNLVISMVTDIAIVMVNVLIWKAVFKTNDVAASADLQMMLTYCFISTFLSLFYSTKVARKMNQDIRSGDIVMEFYRPYPVLLRYFAQDVGSIMANSVFQGVPLMVLMYLVIGQPWRIANHSVGLFVLSVGIGFVIQWCINAIIGVLNFWTDGIADYSRVMNALIKVFSGSFIPLWFFPERMQEILSLLPFPYIYQAPLSIYVGKVQGRSAAMILFVQMAWSIILIAVLMLIQKMARQRVMIQGG